MRNGVKTGIILAGAAYALGVVLNGNYPIKAQDLRQLAEGHEGAPQSSRLEAVKLADSFDAKDRELQGWNPKVLIPYLDVLNGDLFRYISSTNKVTVDNPPLAAFAIRR